jgi:hypothetical protein
MFAFFFFLFVILVVYYATQTMHEDSKKEGFTNKNPTASVVIPKENVPEKLSSPVSKEEVKASSLPGKLPASPYDQVSKSAPLPYQDATQQKANASQLQSLLEMLKGFMTFESHELADRSDPSIQLPLQTARADMQELQMQMDVVSRNPGVQPDMTLQHLHEVGSNLSFLQQKVRLFQTAGGPETAGGETAIQTANPLSSFMKSLEEGFQNPSSSSQKSPAASLEDLKTFISRIQGEMARLSVSGTTDPVVKARVASLGQMKKDVEQIVSEVMKGSIKPMEIPIAKADIEKALPLLGKPSEPLPQLVKSWNLPPGIANLLPSNLQKDPTTMNEIRTLMDKYADTIANGISATFEVKYTAPHERQTKTPSTVDQTGFPSVLDLDRISNQQFMPATHGAPVTDRLASTPLEAGRGPSHFDWKQRAKEIENQVKKRGLKPAEFGIMPPNTKVSKEFSWKGYAKMICTRLQATMDPGLPETCGCPPMDWKGWRGT